MIIDEINEIGQYIPLHYHFQMLSDNARMDAFRTAIEQVVKPHHRVIELGSGTGILSFLAAKQGAQVFSVEFNPTLVAASRKFINDNGFSHKVQIHQGDASSILPAEPVDVVICEMLHSALLREKQVQVVSDFRDLHYARFGKLPKFLPCATLLGVQPVQQSFDFNGYYAPVPTFQSAYETSNNCIAGSDPIVYKIVDYDNSHVEAYNADMLFPIKNDHTINALRFITKNLLNIDIFTGQTVDWHNQHLVLPLHSPLQLKAGQTLRVHFSYRPGDSIEALNNAINVEVLDSIVKLPLSLTA